MLLGCLKKVDAYFDSDIKSSFLVYDALKFLHPKILISFIFTFKVHPCVDFLLIHRLPWYMMYKMTLSLFMTESVSIIPESNGAHNSILLVSSDKGFAFSSV